MRVLIVVHGCPPAAQGGSEIHAWDLAIELSGRQGHTVCVLTREQDSARDEHAVRREERDGIAIVWINNTFRGVRNFADTYDDDRITLVAEREIDEFGPDVAHVHHLTCLSTGIVAALRSRGIPCVMTLHDYWLLCHRGQLLDIALRPCQGPEPTGCQQCLGTAAPAWAYALRSAVGSISTRLPAAGTRRVDAVAAWAARQWRRYLAHHLRATDTFDPDAPARRLEHMRRVCAGVTHFLAPSIHMRNRFVQFGIAPDRIAVAEYGTDLRRFAPSAAGRPGSQPLRLGFLGSLMVSKGVHVLLDAFARLPPGSASLDIYGSPVAYHGDASYADRIRPLLDTPGVRVHGPVSHTEVPGVMASIDALVVPSIWHENSPLVIREAFAAGVPVVASRTGGIPETVIDGVGGWLFEIGSSADLGRVLTDLVARPEAIADLRRGIPAVRDLTDEAASLHELYVSLRRVSAPRHRTAAIVLNYRSPDDTLLAVRSLLSSDRPPDEVIVIDNDAAGAGRSSLAGVMPSIVYLPMAHNLGFPGGVNAGIRAARSRGVHRVLLVNSDALLRPDCLTELQRVMDETGAAVVGPLVLSRRNPDLVATAGVAYDRRSGRMRQLRHGERHESRVVQLRTSVDAVSGCVMLIDRSAFETAGDFDEAYFFGFEDIDFCARVRDGGHNVIVAHRAIAYHEGGRSIGPDSPRRLYFAARNHLRLARKVAPASGHLASFWRAGYVVALNLAHAVRASGSTRPARLGAVIRGVRDHIRGQYGAGSGES